MTQLWRQELKTWAQAYASVAIQREGILGAAIGGSLARGQEWRHSDLELGVLVEQYIPTLPYFNIDSGRGVELIQMARGDLEDQVRRVEGGDLTPVQLWPIQLWQCRVAHDPSGLLARFKTQFDACLFHPEVIDQKISGQRAKIEQALGEARQLLTEGRPRMALCRVRYAANDAILAVHWQHGELPRSQNRTDSRLRWLCHKHDCMPFYSLYREIFALSETSSAVRVAWPRVRDQVLELTRLWGDSARDFFNYAVDSHFAWRQNAGILTVYRLYVPIAGAPERGIAAQLDDPTWAAQNPDLLDFLGLSRPTPEHITDLINRLEKSV